MIEFSDIDKEQLRAFVFQEHAQKMSKQFGRNLAAFWAIARGIGDPTEPFHKQRFFNVNFVSDWHTLSENSHGEPNIEQKRWTIWVYDYDHRKEDPFATDPDSKTLLYKDILLDHRDVEYPYLERQM